MMWLQDADGILFVANNSLGVPLANPLDVTVGPNGTLWVAEIGGNEITVLAPGDVILPGDNDSDDDGILNVDDPFLRDAANGTGVIVAGGTQTVWEFSQGADDTTPGPDGFGGGLTGAHDQRHDRLRGILAVGILPVLARTSSSTT